ncbi:thioesterase family protein [Hyphomonas chukchiensis]|mgnify:FL=1|uniref:thioesterase family protein n=1 Tax=Hyphomonas chukchiensis TaxID=1280947 RepID=UPI0030FC677D
MDRVDDFEEATRLERLGEQLWAVDLRADWGLWSPAGGFISALALRAAGEATRLPRPASTTCHFLRMGKYGPAELRAEILKSGRRSELVRMELVQESNVLLMCHVWAVQDETPGLVHDASRLQNMPTPQSLKSYEELHPDRPAPLFLQRFEERPIKGMPEAGDGARDPELTGLYKFRPRARAENTFVDAARAMILLDTYGWMAQYPAHPEDDPSPWIAPNMDYHYRFHRPTTEAEWLHMRIRAGIAEGGLMSTDGEIHDLEGRLLVSGTSQLMCLPRPGA